MSQGNLREVQLLLYFHEYSFTEPAGKASFIADKRSPMIVTLDHDILKISSMSRTSALFWGDNFAQKGTSTLHLDPTPHFQQRYELEFLRHH